MQLLLYNVAYMHDGTKLGDPAFSVATPKIWNNLTTSHSITSHYNKLFLPLLSKENFGVFTCVSYAEAVIDIGWTSVCLSHAGTVSKRLNVLSCFLHHTIAHPF